MLVTDGPVLDAPIVLAHGLFGFGRIGVGGLTIAEYFGGIPAYLEAFGNRVLVTQVPAVAGISRRARVLGEQIADMFPDEPVHIIGHSMGGLDARALLKTGDWSRRVLSLTTIATPHLGSPLADLVKLRVGWLYDWMRLSRIDHEGFLDVTRPAARAFHRAHPIPEGVACFSVAGIPSAEEVCRPLRRTHKLLERIEGPNDGLVSLASAAAYGTPLRSWPLDHLRQTNWLVPHSRGELDPSVAAFYVTLLRNLEMRGFGARKRRLGIPSR